MNLPISSTPAIGPLPTMYDLPSDNPEDSGLPDEFHGLQPQILSETLKLSGYTPLERFNAFDLNLYYDSTHTKWYKRPDWFLVVGTTRMYRGHSLRSSYVVWDEGIPPSVVIEFLSPGTEVEDLGRFSGKPIKSNPNKPPAKFTVYEKILKIPNYIVFDEETHRIWFFRLVNDCYQEQPLAPTNPRLWIPELDLGLALWRGEYRESLQPWLRWCDRSGNLFPTLEESADAARLKIAIAQAEVNAAQEATNAAQEATNAAQEAAKIAQEATNAAQEVASTAQAEANAAIAQTRQAITNLLATGMSPTRVAEVFGISIDDLPKS